MVGIKGLSFEQCVFQFIVLIYNLGKKVGGYVLILLVYLRMDKVRK